MPRNEKEISPRNWCPDGVNRIEMNPDNATGKHEILF